VKGTAPMLNQLRSLRLKRRRELISPLKDKDVNSLRYPGQSIQQMMDDALLVWNTDVVTVVIALTIAGWSWFQYFSPEDSFLTALVTSAIALSVLAVMIPSLSRRLRKLKRLREARNGERIDAEHLNQLIADGYTVFHDVPCGFKKGKKMLFNIDHLLVGKKGIFVVETKTPWKKKQGGKVHYKLRYDGQKVSFLCGAPLDKPDPINQVKKQVDWVKRELVQTTNKQFDVIPVVTFPGWFIDMTARANHVIVLGTPTVKAARSILLNRDDQLTDDEVALVKHRIKMQIQDHRP
jgi:hypothetical protein